MKVDVTAVLKNHKGHAMPLAPSANKDAPPATLRDVIEVVCVQPNEVVKTAEDKMRVYRILQRTMAAPVTVSLDASEVVLLKKMIGAAYSAVIVGALYDILDPPPAEPLG